MNPAFSYWRWFTNNTGAEPNADWWQVLLLVMVLIGKVLKIILLLIHVGEDLLLELRIILA